MVGVVGGLEWPRWVADDDDQQWNVPVALQYDSNLQYSSSTLQGTAPIGSATPGADPQRGLVPFVPLSAGAVPVPAQPPLRADTRLF
jgi:hypothetical protein